MARKGDKRRNRKQRDARHQAQKLDVNPETIDTLKTETADPLKTETADPLKTETADPLETETVDPLKTETADLLETETVDPLKTETIDPLKTETIDPLETETVDPLKTLLAAFTDDIEKIKLEMMKRGYEVEVVVESSQARRLWDQDMAILSLMRRLNGLPSELQGPRFPVQRARPDHPWNSSVTDLFPPNFIKHLLDAGYDFGVQIIDAGLTQAESNKFTALNHKKYGPQGQMRHDGPPNGTVIFVAREVHPLAANRL
jgi:hypothetical protein